VKASMARIKNEKDFDYLSCPYDHICGIRVKFKYYFTKDSPVEFKFPMGGKKDWTAEMRANNFLLAKEHENETKEMIDWSNVPEEDKFCTICDIQFETAEDLVDHCERDRIHYENSERFELREPEPDKLNRNN